MGASAEDLYELLRSMRRDCTDIQTKITSAFAVLNELNIQDVPHVVCPKCGAKLKGPRTLAEHLHVSHPTDAAYTGHRVVAWHGNVVQHGNTD